LFIRTHLNLPKVWTYTTPQEALSQEHKPCLPEIVI
jgi:hypothetical protein